MLNTRFYERFGIEAPLVVAPMGPEVTGPELVAAVCNAGGFAILQAQMSPPQFSKSVILRTLTSRPFSVNLVLHFSSLRTSTRRERSNRWLCLLDSPAGLIGEIRPAADIVKKTVEGADHVIW